MRCGAEGHHGEQAGLRDKHGQRDRQRAVGGELLPLEQEDLHHEEDRTEQGLRLTAPEMHCPEIKPAEHRHAREHQRATQEHDPRRPAAQPPRDPERDHDRVELGQERRGRGAGELQAVVLEQHAGANREADQQALLQLEPGERAEFLPEHEQQHGRAKQEARRDGVGGDEPCTARRQHRLVCQRDRLHERKAHPPEKRGEHEQQHGPGVDGAVGSRHGRRAKQNRRRSLRGGFKVLEERSLRRRAC